MKKGYVAEQIRKNTARRNGVTDFNDRRRMQGAADLGAETPEQMRLRMAYEANEFREQIKKLRKTTFRHLRIVSEPKIGLGEVVNDSGSRTRTPALEIIVEGGVPIKRLKLIALPNQLSWFFAFPAVRAWRSAQGRWNGFPDVANSLVSYKADIFNALNYLDQRFYEEENVAWRAEEKKRAYSEREQGLPVSSGNWAQRFDRKEARKARKKLGTRRRGNLRARAAQEATGQVTMFNPSAWPKSR